MPTYEIGLNDGRKLRIDADSQEAALAGAQHYMSTNPAPSPGLADTAADVGKSAAAGAVEGLQETGGALGDVSQSMDAAAKQNPAVNQEKLAQMRSDWLSRMVPTTAGIQKLMGYTPYEPKTTAGQITKSATEMAAPGILGAPEAALGRIARGAVGGAASEVAGKATEGTPLEVPARVLAAVAAPGAAERAITKAPARLTAQELKSAGEQGYQNFRNSGLELDGAFGQNYARNTKAQLNGMGLSERNSPQVHGVLDELAGNTYAPGGSTLHAPQITALQNELREYAQQVGTDFKPTPQAKAAYTALQNLQGELQSAHPYVMNGNLDQALGTLKDADANWGAYRRVSGLDRADLKAQLMAAGENSGSNIGNKQRQQLRQILLGKGRGFNADEQAAMERIVRGNFATNTLRRLSNVLGGGGGIGAAGLALGAAASTEAGGEGPWGAAAPLAGMALRGLANRAVAKQVAKLQAQTALRSPLGRQQVPQRTPPMISPGATIRAIIAQQQARNGQTPNTAMQP